MSPNSHPGLEARGDMSGQGGSDGKILLVEDSPTQARQLGMLLESHGFEVAVASSGSQALEMALETVPDLVVLDLMLPDMDGYTVCRRLRKQSPYYVPVLMVTQRKAVEDRIDGLEVGADDYLPKPFDERELLARIRALMRIKRLQDELHHRLKSEKRAYKALREMALTDPLTGLYNRHHFPSLLQHEFEMARRYGTSLACIMLDIDHFRTFNNRHGHLVGDWVLQNVANLLRSSVRRVDIIARYGGEEFVILLPLSNMVSAAETARRLCQRVEGTRWESAVGPLRITISLGVAAFPEVAVETAEELVQCADQALLRAKANGRNRVEKWTEEGREETL